MIAAARQAVRSLDVAIDFGTASVRLAAGSQRLRERRSASGERAALAGGVVADREAATEVLRPILYRARSCAGFSRVRALACAPSDASAKEKAALADCITRAGASAVYIAQEPLAAAIGAGIDVASPYAKLIMDIGEGVTDCAVIRSAQVFRSRAIRVGCSDFRRTIQQRVSECHAMNFPTDKAEQLLRASGVGSDAPELTIECACEKKPCSVKIPAGELHAALAAQLAASLGSLESLLHDLPPTISAELSEQGIYLSGGGALLKGMPAQVVRVAEMDVCVVGDPLSAVVSGIRAMLPIASTLRLWKV